MTATPRQPDDLRVLIFTLGQGAGNRSRLLASPAAALPSRLSRIQLTRVLAEEYRRQQRERARRKGGEGMTDWPRYAQENGSTRRKSRR